MESFLLLGLLLGIALLIGGLVGVVRGRIDQRWFVTRRSALLPLILGLVLLFSSTAPPTGAMGVLPERVEPPPRAAPVYRDIVPHMRERFAPNSDIVEEQQALFPKWEAQLLDAHAQADATLSEVIRVMDILHQGHVDRFSAWSRLGVLSQDLKQASLLIHDLIPPTKLNLQDQMTLQEALDGMHESLQLKRDGIRALQRFTQSLHPRDLAQAQDAFDAGHKSMHAALEKMAEVRARLDL